MGYTPNDIIEYIEKEGLEADFMLTLARYKDGFSIGEIPDARYKRVKNGYRLFSDAYDLNVLIEDDDIVAALSNEMYVSAFISRNQDKYNLHFYVHSMLASMKADNEEVVAKEVVRYMIMATVMRFRLDSPEKVRAYIG